MKLHNTYKNAFTLVELIVVVTILALLATIGFVAYSSYLLEARDSNRIATLIAISDGFELYKTKAKLPVPDGNVGVKSDKILIGWQGYAGEEVLKTINFHKGGVDPLDGQYYSYFLTSNRKHFQLLAFLEKKETLEIQDVDAFYLNRVAAQNIDYYDRYPKLYGKALGIMTDTFKTPLQEIQSITDKGFLDILETDDSYIAYFSDQDSISGDKTVLGALSPYSSCARLKDFLGKSVTTFYDINPRSIAGESYRVFCDMELAGGGWTLIATSAEDGVNTWTYHNTIDSGVANIFNKDPIGNIEDYKQDFKSQAYGDIKFKDVLFVDKQGVWGAYDDVQLTRAFTMDDFIPRELSCPYEGTGRSYKLTSGSVSQNKGLLGEQQDRALFFTVRDNEQGCDENRIGHKWSHDAYGPTWGYGRNSLLSPDDPGLVGWGPSRTYGVLDSLGTGSMIGPKKPGVECRDARLGTKKVDFSICNSNDGDYILWFVR